MYVFTVTELVLDLVEVLVKSTSPSSCPKWIPLPNFCVHILLRRSLHLHHILDRFVSLGVSPHSCIRALRDALTHAGVLGFSSVVFLEVMAPPVFRTLSDIFSFNFLSASWQKVNSLLSLPQLSWYISVPCYSRIFLMSRP